MADTVVTDLYYNTSLIGDSVTFSLAPGALDADGFIKPHNVGFVMLPYNFDNEQTYEYDVDLLTQNAMPPPTSGFDLEDYLRILENMSDLLIFIGDDDEDEDENTTDSGPGSMYDMVPTTVWQGDPGDLLQQEGIGALDETVQATYVGDTSQLITAEQKAQVTTGLYPGSITLFADVIGPTAKYNFSTLMADTGDYTGMATADMAGIVADTGNTVIWAPYQNAEPGYPKLFADAETLQAHYNQITFEHSPMEAAMIGAKYGGIRLTALTVDNFIQRFTQQMAVQIAQVLSAEKLSQKKAKQKIRVSHRDFVALQETERVNEASVEGMSATEFQRADDTVGAGMVTIESIHQIGSYE